MEEQDGRHRGSDPQAYYTAPGRTNPGDPGTEGSPPGEEAGDYPRTHAGVEKIIGYRAWRVRKGRLHSIYFDQYVWEPGEPMTGMVQDPVGKYIRYAQEGVHAFNNPESVQNYVHFVTIYPGTANAFFNETDPPIDDEFVWGTVELWGTVWEHSLGYRAENARIRSLDGGTIKAADLKALSKAYNVGP